MLTLRRVTARVLALFLFAALLPAACEHNLGIGPADTLATIVVTPNPKGLAINGTQQFIATGFDSSGHVVTISPTPTWFVVAGGGAIVTASGMFTAGTSAGTFVNTVKATNGVLSGFATVTVGSGALATITVTPNPVTIGTNVVAQFTATGRDASGNIVSIAPTWSVVAGGGVIGSTSGLFTAQSAAGGPFTNTVKATAGAISGFATITVVAAGPLASITVTPNPANLAPGDIQQFTATGFDAGGTVITISPAPTWSVVASVGGGAINAASGLYTAGAVTGTFSNSVKATSGAISGFATVIIGGVPPIVTLGAAATYGILAGSTVTCITGGTIKSDVGVSPGSTLTGFPPCVITGTTHLADATAAAAQAALTTAYNQLVAMPCGTTISADLGGTTLAPGVYCSASSVGLTGTVTLDGQGDPNAIFVIQAGSTLTTGTSAAVNLIGGAQAKNVYWQIGSSATLGTGTAFKGNILALTSITLNDNVTMLGRALARNGAVTLQTNNTITLP